jgi:NADH-quinone oxidoreductase subunit N
VAALDAGGGALALIALLSAAIAAYFYLRFALTLYEESDHDDASRVAVPRASVVVIAVGVIVAVLFGLWPGPLATWAQHATLLFLP